MEKPHHDPQSYESAVPFWSMSTEAVTDHLKTHAEHGLSQTEATERLAKYGRNSLESGKSVPAIAIIIEQLKSPLIFILLIAGLVTVSIGHAKDAIFILIAVLVNTALGFWQENKAEHALAELKTYLRNRSRVIRDDTQKEIDAEEVVIGDIVRLSQGDRVPADGRIIWANDFQTDEAVLTGESLPSVKSADPVQKDAGLGDRSSMVFAGTLVTQGVSTVVICATDAGTEIGKIASYLASAGNEQTPLQKSITSFSVQISIILGLLTVVMFVIGVASGRPLIEMFLASVAVAVAAIPEGLPISMTVILAIGVERMAKRKGIVRKLVAAEALGSTTIILTDKTGTLTMAKMELSESIVREGLDPQSIIVNALTNTDVLIENPSDPIEAWRISGKIMETALVRAAARRGISVAMSKDTGRIVKSIPFNSLSKYSTSLVRTDTGYMVISVGAPDVLLAASSLDDSAKAHWQEMIHTHAATGERVLGVCTKTYDATSSEGEALIPLTPDGAVLDGILTFRDPIRPGLKDTVARVRNAGVRTIILTGDHSGTAQAVAREIGLATDGGCALDALELRDMPEDTLRERLKIVTVVSRVTPYDKLRIAKLLQQSGEIVAMTGDGVNDAPCIKQANVGIAMGSGTEVARGVADLILLDDNFETIVAAIEEGRQILANIKKVLVYLLSNVADGLILIGGSVLTGLPLPMNALQILWVNFFADSFPAIAYAFEKEPDSLQHRPNAKLGLFNPLMRFLILVIGLSTSAMLFVIYSFLMAAGHNPSMVQTFIFTTYGVYTLFVALSVRSLEKGIFSYPLFSNPKLIWSIVFGFFLMALAIYLPLLQDLFGTVALSLPWIGGVFLIGIINIILIEAAKYWFRTHHM